MSQLQHSTNRINQEGKLSVREIKFIIRVSFAFIFFIFGFNFSRTTFFKEYPLFGVDYLAEILISVLAGLLGFYTIPLLGVKTKRWIEGQIHKTVNDIVYDFWSRQTGRINQAKKEKQLLKTQNQQVLLLNAPALDGVVVDTSVLIDGRLLSLVKSGFFDKNLLVLKSVITELQQVADSKDKLKRQRGRKGLDILRDLRKITKVTIPEFNSKEKEVDDAVTDFAKQNKLKLLTLDFNLMKVAEVKGVEVLNINVLVEALKTVVLPGEDLKVKILQKGKEKSQGIGYLDDGTMVVVENAKELVGEELDVRVIKIIQSPAGKMLFCDKLS